MKLQYHLFTCMIIYSHYFLLTVFDHSELNIFTCFAIWLNYILVIHWSGIYLGTWMCLNLVTEEVEILSLNTGHKIKTCTYLGDHAAIPLRGLGIASAISLYTTVGRTWRQQLTHWYSRLTDWTLSDLWDHLRLHAQEAHPLAQGPGWCRWQRAPGHQHWAGVGRWPAGCPCSWTAYRLVDPGPHR